MDAHAKIPFDAAARVRLAKLLGMTGSANDNEALVAARKANELVKGAGLQWLDVVALGVPASAKTVKAPRKPRQPKVKTFRDFCELIMRSPLATSMERDFAFDLLATGAEITRRDVARLKEIWAKLRPARRGRKAGRR
jgi:hypothetical protein